MWIILCVSCSKNLLFGGYFFPLCTLCVSYTQFPQSYAQAAERLPLTSSRVFHITHRHYYYDY